jgi:deoxycytidylate deaminase
VDSWDEYFLNIAKVVSIKSKDPKCPVGAVIVSEDNIILSTGFNGAGGPPKSHDPITHLRVPRPSRFC